MAELTPALHKASKRYLDLVAGNFQRHDVNVTGRTLQSIHTEFTKTGFRVLGADHVLTVEFGRGPTKNASGGGQVVRNIMAWLEAKGLWQESLAGEANTGLNPYAVAKTIHIKGTRLWRGEDPRFPGKTQSGILFDPIQPMKEELKADLAKLLSKELTVTIKKYFQQ